MTITIKTKWYTKHTWIIGGRGSDLRLILTSSVIINSFSVILKVKVADTLRPNSTSYTITPTIASFVFINNIIHMARRTSYTQQSTMVNWVMGVIGAVLGPIYTSPITTNSLSHIVRGKLSGLFRPISTSDIINYYIPPWVSIIPAYIFPPISIIKTDITIVFSWTISSTWREETGKVRNLPRSRGLWEE